ncbi:MAG TPA: hypothetical protein VHC42_09805 [Rhizomicrobium sp.]|nr:hypothetical protein [Rhizomicrobium sp.]
MRSIFWGAVLCLCASAPAWAQQAPAWRGYGGNAQHTAPAPAKAQKLRKILWRTPVDLAPQGGELFIHYASPMITASNTVLLAVKTGSDTGFQIEAHRGASGTLIWKKTTDFVFAPHDWTPSFPAHLTAQNRLYYAGAGGTVLFRDDPDLKKGAHGRMAFYGIDNYRANKAALRASVMIDSPITADDAGNIYFAFAVTGSNPLGLKSGVARIGADGKGMWVSAADAADDASIVEVAQNCAPAVSADQSTIYLAVSDGAFGYLLGLDSATLRTKYKVRLMDPGSGEDALLFDDSSASPTVGPDGDIYYGVVENPFPYHYDRGWLLHFSGDLATLKTPGSFGWDDTASVVPTSAVTSYTGSSPYLLMTKYNNYYGAGGDGHNEIAIIDPDATQKDRFSSVTVMREIMTKVNPTQMPGEPLGVVYEWCINSAVVDASGKAVIANAEDGHTYRWDLVTGGLTSVDLNPPIGEAYTPTEIGPDGTIYAINDAVLYALGK